MALRWFEGFETTRSQSGMARKYDLPGGSFNASWSTGRLQGFCLRNTSGGNTSVFRTPQLVSPGQGTWVIGVALNVDNSNNILDPWIQLMDGTNEQCRLKLVPGTNTNNVRVAFCVGATTLATSSELVAGQWYYVELKVVLATGATGSYTLRVNEVQEFTASSVVTANASPSVIADRVSVRSGFGSDYIQMDDMYILDGSGADSNDWLGDQVIEGGFPIGDGVTSGVGVFPVSPATHWDKVDDPATAVPDDNTTYVFSTADGQKDLYTFAPLAFLTGSITGVMLDYCVALSTSGSRNFKAKYRDTTPTEVAGTTQAITQTAFSPFKYQIWSRDPITTAAWTVARINAGQFGWETG